MELRHLRYFVAVAEMENVSRAALKLHVSQPALSRQIRDLEDEIGFSLLERTAKSVRLTDAGRSFLDNARALLQNADEAVLKARAVARAEPTELHVGYAPTPTAEILPKALRAFQRAMPNVHVRLYDWSMKDILEGVRDGRLQLGLIVPPTKASGLKDLRYEELFHERVCVAVAPQHPFARRRAVPIAEVAAEPLIGLTREDYPNFYDYLSILFSKLKQKPRVVEEYDSFSGIISAVEAGTGVAIGADVFGHSFGNRVKLLHITPEPKPIPVGIVGTKGRLSSAAEKFWQCAKEAALRK
ncbi:MAG TPA: LysR family transcriptional regulator [Candidatus Udaeobacter sp.]|nr:LysR family transcriptional regulator [Candidatus Udaeobacter sp.]